MNENPPGVAVEAAVAHRLGQNSTLRGVKTTTISVLMCKKKQRLEVVRAVLCSSQCISNTPNESNPPSDCCSRPTVEKTNAGEAMAMGMVD
eukprot:COSAG02_NODE_8914_length_2402_cov_2.934433_1_plen_91_part_00